MDIYSRSYGAIENERTEPKFSVPPDYNGSLYREVPKAPEPPAVPEEKVPENEAPPPRESIETEKNESVFRSVLEKISAEDLIMFILILSMLFGDSDESGTVLAVILAILLT